ncbi:MAG: hypothetical protein COV44_07445 [Deltaproteobacteria bacterium CG11_big_fil_rev_8_21_14_0_20_45_16]|nr:MAG: hypothetical protein COV44_07445 [Deltaproteobacteria bacterium CG11_big_fil_rev_8_21_14_0_20_45_16]
MGFGFSVGAGFFSASIALFFLSWFNLFALAPNASENTTLADHGFGGSKTCVVNTPSNNARRNGPPKFNSGAHLETPDRSAKGWSIRGQVVTWAMIQALLLICLQWTLSTAAFMPI